MKILCFFLLCITTARAQFQIEQNFHLAPDSTSPDPSTVFHSKTWEQGQETAIILDFEPNQREAMVWSDTNAVAVPLKQRFGGKVKQFKYAPVSLNGRYFYFDVNYQQTQYALAAYSPGTDTLQAIFPYSIDTIEPCPDLWVAFQGAVYFTMRNKLTNQHPMYKWVAATNSIELDTHFNLVRPQAFFTDGARMYVQDEKVIEFDGVSTKIAFGGANTSNIGALQGHLFGVEINLANQSSLLDYDPATGVTTKTPYVGPSALLGNLHFASHQGEIYISGLSSAGVMKYDTQLQGFTKTLYYPVWPQQTIGAPQIITFENTIFASSFAPGIGAELFKFDPVLDTFVLVRDLYQGPASANPWRLAALQDKLYFTANDGQSGTELWSYRACFQAQITATPSLSGQSTGTATVTNTSGTAPFTYLWTNGATTANAQNLPPGIYQVTVTDANGCQVTLSVQVETMVGFTSEISGIEVQVYPNPFLNRLTLEAILEQEFDVQVIDAQGLIKFQRNWLSSTPLVLDGLELPAGVYFLRLTVVEPAETRQISTSAITLVQVLCVGG
jgi:hypothetical protein